MITFTKKILNGKLRFSCSAFFDVSSRGAKTLGPNIFTSNRKIFFGATTCEINAKESEMLRFSLSDKPMHI